MLMPGLRLLTVLSRWINIYAGIHWDDITEIIDHDSIEDAIYDSDDDVQ